jgi:hypothetical protein
MAALNHAASLDERITNSRAWKIGLSRPDPGRPAIEIHPAMAGLLEVAQTAKSPV